MARLHDELDEDRRWIAGAFREMRLARGLTQERAAEEVDLQKAATISEFENSASRIPPPWMRQRLYAAYGVADERRATVEARIARCEARERRLQLVTLRGNPPPADGPLIGREGEVRETLCLLRAGDACLVAITGPGGVGKTRLAIEVAVAYAREVQRQGVFVALGEVRHREGLDHATELQREIARALGLAGAEGALAGRVEAALRRVRLLVVDNLEHMLPALPYLVALRAAMPTLRVLLTSRDRPEGQEQQIVPLAPLTLPEAGAVEDSAHLLAAPAVALLLDRMRRFRPDYQPSAADAAALAGICRDLDGLPLALELAAPHCVDLPIAVAAEKLRRRLAVLRDAAGTRLARQRSIQATLDWSYELLDAEDRRLFARLAVCAGADWEAVRQLAALGEAVPEVEERIGRLCRSSLVEFGPGRHGGGRYRMLTLVRDYALERLATGPDDEASRNWHGEHYAALVDRFGEAVDGAGHRAAGEVLGGELENVYELLDRALRAGPTGRDLRTVSRLSAYLLERGYTHDAAAWLRRALPAADRPLPRAVLLLNLAEAEAWRGGYDEVLSLCDAVLAEGMTAAWLENVYPVSIAADALRLGGMVRFIRGDLAGAREWFERSLDDARRVDYRDGEALALEHLGRLLLEIGDRERARQYAEEALAIAVAAGRELLGARVRRTCAAIAVADDDPARALEHLADIGRLASASGDATIGVACDLTRAILARRQGDRRLAADLLVATLRHCRRRGDDFDTAIVLEELAQLAAGCRQAETAVRLYGVAAAIRGRLSVPDLPRSPGNRADYERRQRELRELVGIANYECLWSAGERMPFDDVIAEAVALARDASGA